MSFLKVEFIEINLRKTKWLILGTYRSPNQSIDYFFENVGNALDNAEPSLSELLLKYDSKNLVKEKTFF